MVTTAYYLTELWPFYLLSYGVGQCAVLGGIFIIFSDSSSLTCLRLQLSV